MITNGKQGGNKMYGPFEANLLVSRFLERHCGFASIYSQSIRIQQVPGSPFVMQLSISLRHILLDYCCNDFLNPTFIYLRNVRQIRYKYNSRFSNLIFKWSTMLQGERMTYRAPSSLWKVLITFSLGSIAVLRGL